MIKSLLELLQMEHGPLFWVAILLLSAGIALVTGTLVWQMRKLFLRDFRLWNRVNEYNAGDETGALSTVGAAYDGRAVSAVASENRKQSGQVREDTKQNISDLARRLQEAADRLERMAADFSKGDQNTAESLLKPTGDEVEYVFKASTV